MNDHSLPQQPPQYPNNGSSSGPQPLQRPGVYPMPNMPRQQAGPVPPSGNIPPGWVPPPGNVQPQRPGQIPQMPPMSQQPYQAGQPNQVWGTPQQRHPIPKCLSCGAVTQWQIEPILLARHIIIFLVLLLFFGAGLIYLPVVLIIRSGTEHRSKICPHCGARNLWTFLY